MTVQITVPDVDPLKIRTTVLEGLAELVNRLLRRAEGPIVRRAGEICVGLIKGAPEARSLTDPDGILRGQLGVVDATASVDAVASAIASAIRSRIVPVRAFGGRLEGGMTLGIVREDLAELRPLFDGPLGSFESERGYQVDWLKWLLTEGDSIIIADYRFLSSPGNQRSRTRLGVMQKGGVWSVPSQFAGTYRENWLTRALSGIREPLVKAVADELRRAS